MKIRQYIFLFCALILSLGVITANEAHAKRVAFVVGIDDYDNIDKLLKARNDADAVSAALETAGFEVTTMIDPGRRDLILGLSEFSSFITPGDEVVFYFAGHGLEVAGRNYLLPADVPVVRPGSEMLLTSESIATDKVLDLFQQRGARLSFLILDACRNNPFPKEGLRSTGGKQGLAAVNKDLLPVGTFILYSAGVGQTALDHLGDTDGNPNSVFTRSLLPALQEPGLSLGEITRKVRSDVRRLARSVGHDQFPSYYDQIDVEEGGFYFHKPGSRGAVPIGGADHTTSGQENAASRTTPSLTPCDKSGSVWDVVKASQSAEVFRVFEQTYPDCPIYVALAREKLRAFEKAPAPQVSAATTAAARDNGLCFDLWHQRNSIFDRYGYCFSTAKGKKHFDNAGCTTKNPQLSAADLLEVGRLKGLEKQNGC